MCTLYYFSGTGNSLKIARDLAEKLEDCKLVPIASIWQQETIISESEKVGFIFPLYWLGLPKIVYDFINRIDLNKANYIFSVITCGGGKIGGSLHQLRNILKRKSKNLNSGFFIKMPDNYIPVFDAPSEEKQKILFENARKKVDKISMLIKESGMEVEKEKLPLIGRFMNRRFRKKVNNSDTKFSSDDNCNSCGICKDICPVKNISIVEGIPQWQHKCQRCFACIHFCPQKAIQYGRKTSKRKRYHHPEVTIQDIINQN